MGASGKDVFYFYKNKIHPNSDGGWAWYNGRVIKLAHLSPFAEGGFKKCFVHPDDPNRCLKIAKPKEMSAKISGRFYRKFLPQSRYNANLLEWRGYEAAERLGDSQVWEHIPRCFGFVPTDLGSALCVQLMRNADGSIAPTLCDRIKQGGGGQTLQTSLQEFKQFMARAEFYAGGLQNILSVQLDDQTERLYFAEFEYRRKIPHLVVPAFYRKRLQKEITQLQKNFDHHTALCLKG